MIRSSVCFALAVATLSTGGIGCTAAPPEVAVDPQAIIGGTAATSATASAVVMLASYPANMSDLLTCSSVLVAPTILLTAAHCVDAATHPNYTFGVFKDQDGSAYTTLALLAPHLLAVASVHADASYQTTPPYNADIAVVELAAPLTGVTPLPLRTTAPDSTILGAAAQIIGYGETTYGTPNQTRNIAQTTVAAADDAGDTITVGDATHLSCLGDSGGPAIVDGTVIALDSYTDVSGCTAPAHYTRVDLYGAFINPYLPATGADAGAGGGDAGTGGKSGGGCDAGGGAGGGGAILLLLATAIALVARKRA